MQQFEIVRAVAAPVRAEAAEGAADDAMPTMDVRFSALGNWYEINSFWEGRFLERVDPGAFTKTIKENRANIRVLFNHGFDPQIGEKVLGEIADLREDADAAVGVVSLFDTSYVRDLLPGLRAGVYGSSMRMVVVKDEVNNKPGVSEGNPDGIPERTIKEISLREFGPVTFPANPLATSGVRSETDTYYEQLRSRDPHRVDELARSLQTTPPLTAAGPTTAPADGAGGTTAAEPASHSGGLTHAQRRERIHHLNGAAS
jgi:HK97 family phage prohead protease